MTTVLVTQHAEEQAAERANQERNREGPQGGNHLHTGAGIGEKDLTQCVSHKSIYAEIEPLHRVAERGCSNGFAQLSVINDCYIA